MTILAATRLHATIGRVMIEVHSSSDHRGPHPFRCVLPAQAQKSPMASFLPKRKFSASVHPSFPSAWEALFHRSPEGSVFSQTVYCYLNPLIRPSVQLQYFLHKVFSMPNAIYFFPAVSFPRPVTGFFPAAAIDSAGLAVA